MIDAARIFDTMFVMERSPSECDFVAYYKRAVFQIADRLSII